MFTSICGGPEPNKLDPPAPAPEPEPVPKPPEWNRMASTSIGMLWRGSTRSFTTTDEPLGAEKNGVFEFAPLVELPPVPKEVLCVAFNPTRDSMIAFTANDGHVHIYELEGGSASSTRVIRHSNHSTRCLAFSPNGLWLVVGGAFKQDGAYKGKLSFYDVEADEADDKTGATPHHSVEKPEMTILTFNTILDCSFSPCGRFVAFGGYAVPMRVIQVMEQEDETKLSPPDVVIFDQEFKIEVGGDDVRYDDIHALPFSSCGRYLSCLTGSGQLVVWTKRSDCDDWSDPRELWSEEWSDPDDILAKPDDDAVKVLGRPMVQKKKACGLRACQFSHALGANRCRFIAIAYLNGTVVVRQSEDGAIMCVIDDELDSPKRGVAFSTDESGLLVVASDSGVNVYHALSNSLACRFADEHQPHCIALTKSGRGLAYGTTRVLETEPGGGRRVIVRALRFDGGDRQNPGLDVPAAMAHARRAAADAADAIDAELAAIKTDEEAAAAAAAADAAADAASASASAASASSIRMRRLR